MQELELFNFEDLKLKSVTIIDEPLFCSGNFRLCES